MSEHLSSSAKAALMLSDTERIRYARNEQFISYTGAKKILTSLENLLDHPKRQRMPCLLIAGRTNNGKSAIAQEFLSLHPPVKEPSAEADVVPVLYVQAPPVPDERRLNAVLLDKLCVPHKTNERADRMMQQLLVVMPNLGVKMLMIDEIHHILAGNRERQRVFLQVLKYISNELQIPIVALGTDNALFALQADAQLANRFVPIAIPEWKHNLEYLGLLKAFEKLLPLRLPSMLTDAQLATRLLTMSEGTIGELARLLSIATEEAIRNQSERISVPLLERLSWVQPSERRNFVAREI